MLWHTVDGRSPKQVTATEFDSCSSTSLKSQGTIIEIHIHSVQETFSGGPALYLVGMIKNCS